MLYNVFMEILQDIDTIIKSVLDSLGAFAPILACLLMLVESMLPMLPLAVFITVNFYYIGTIPGFLISWILTCIGCYLSFRLCRTKFKKHFDSMMDKKEHRKLKKMMKAFDNMKVEELSLLIAIPFTPAFLVNIAAGLSNMNKKKFILSLIIGKFFMVYFWGFVGTSLIDSLKDPSILVKIVFVLIIAYIISKIVNKKFRLE